MTITTDTPTTMPSTVRKLLNLWVSRVSKAMRKVSRQSIVGVSYSLARATIGLSLDARYAG